MSKAERYWANLYTTMAPFYDQFNAKVDYEGRAKFIRLLISKYKKSIGKEMLEVACGTGNYTRIFKKYYKVTGDDASKDMLKVAKRNIKGVKFIEGKFGKLYLGKKFDMIVCKGSMDYNFSKAELKSTLKNFYNQLKPGGVTIFGFETTKKNFKEGIGVRTAFDGKLKVTEISASKIHPGKDNYGRLAVFVIWNGKKFRVFQDQDSQGLYSPKEVLKLMKQVGFKEVYNYWDSSVKDPAYGHGRKPEFVGIK